MTSAAASNLSSPRYGYDFVVAATQDSINSTMKKYMDTLQERYTYILYVRDTKKKETVPITYADLKTATGGVDPFHIPKDEDPSSARVQALAKAKFVAGIKISLGLPANYEDPRKLPPVVTLATDAAAVTYNMLCSDIQIAQLSFSYDGPEWTKITQNDVPNRAWVFQSKVNLMLDLAEFKALPKEVKDGIKNLHGEMFGVQQLLFDLNNAGLQTVPTVDGLDPASDASVILTKYFVNTYFGHMHDQGQPVLNYTVVHKPQNATLKPTDLNFHVNPLNGALDPGLKTLNYLCATDGHKLPPAVNFTWDWLNAQDATQCHGMISINRNTFANYILSQIYPTAKSDCFVPVAKCYWKDAAVWFNAYANGSPDDSKITKTVNPQGSTIIKISYSDRSFEWAEVGGHTELKQDYTKEVTVTGNKITVVTHNIIYLSVKVLLTENAANITDKTLTDTFELAIDEHGQLTTKYTYDVVDKSKTDWTNDFVDFFVGVNDIFDKLKRRNFHTTNFEGHDIDAFRNFMFPGGETFAFKEFKFSDNQDLLAGITYVDPQY